MAKVKATKAGNKVICEKHGVIATIADADDAYDAAAAHDTEHGYEGEDGFTE